MYEHARVALDSVDLGRLSNPRRASLRTPDSVGLGIAVPSLVRNPPWKGIFRHSFWRSARNRGVIRVMARRVQVGRTF